MLVKLGIQQRYFWIQKAGINWEDHREKYWGQSNIIPGRVLALCEANLGSIHPGYPIRSPESTRNIPKHRTRSKFQCDPNKTPKKGRTWNIKNLKNQVGICQPSTGSVLSHIEKTVSRTGMTVQWAGPLPFTWLIWVPTQAPFIVQALPWLIPEHRSRSKPSTLPDMFYTKKRGECQSYCHPQLWWTGKIKLQKRNVVKEIWYHQKNPKYSKYNEYQ